MRSRVVLRHARGCGPQQTRVSLEHRPRVLAGQWPLPLLTQEPPTARLTVGVAMWVGLEAQMFLVVVPSRAGHPTPYTQLLTKQMAPCTSARAHRKKGARARGAVAAALRAMVAWGAGGAGVEPATPDLSP